MVLSQTPKVTLEAPKRTVPFGIPLATTLREREANREEERDGKRQTEKREGGRERGWRDIFEKK